MQVPNGDLILGFLFPMKEDRKPLKSQTECEWTIIHKHKHIRRADLLIVACRMLRHWDGIQGFVFVWVSTPYPSLCSWFSPSFTAPSPRTCYAQDCFGLLCLLLPSSSSEHYCWEMGIIQKETSLPWRSTPHWTALATIKEVKYQIKQSWNVWGQS